MNRRNLLRTIGGGSAALLAGSGPVLPVPGQSGLASVKIKDIKVILTSPAGEHYVITKVITDQPGLYGVACANYRERLTGDPQIFLLKQSHSLIILIQAPKNAAAPFPSILLARFNPQISLFPIS